MSETVETPRVQSVRDWDPIRKAFVHEVELPNFGELSDRFAVPVKAIQKRSAIEGWAILRARYAESQLALSGAVGSLIQASKGESLLIEKFRSVVVQALNQISEEFEGLAELEKPSTRSRRIELAQKLSFSIKNLADTIKSLGITGLPKGLRDIADKVGDDPDGYAKGLSAALTQLNLSVTVNSGDQSQKPVAIVQDKPV